MAVRIESLTVKDLGPIEDKFFEFSSLNLFYGPNESGKTYIVEFMVDSLFKNYGSWIFRPSQSVGELKVSGFDNDKGDQKFFPASRIKMNDLLAEEYSDLPLNLSRLLAIRGSDLFFDDRNRDVERGIFIDFLSNRRMIESVLNKIQKTTQNAILDESGIQASEMGLNRRRLELTSELNGLDSLLDLINRDYSKGELEAIRDQKNKTLERINNVENSKRHYAYTINTEIANIKNKLSRYPEDILQKLGNDLHSFRENERSQTELQNELDKNSDVESKYQWLCKAKDEYEKRTLLYKKEPSLFLLILPLVLVIGADLLLSFGLRREWFYILQFLGVLLTGLFFYFYKKSKDSPENTQEIEGIQKKFKEYFSEELITVTQITTLLGQYEEQHNQYLGMASTVGILNNSEKEISASIIQSYFKLGQENITQEDWESKYKEIRDTISSLEEERNELEMILASLNIPKEELLEEWNGRDYDRREELELRDEKQTIETDAIELENRLSGLKQKLMQATDASEDCSWEILYTKLLEKRNSKEQELKKITAEIIAGIEITAVFNEIKEKEDEKILKKLEDPLILSPIKACTNKYVDLELREDDLYLSDSQNWFRFNELSTGAMDQVLFALRIGFSNMILKKEPLFLIIDDAFQNADWNRRENLFNMVVELVKQKWQVFYFTMDDHIRDRFKEIGKREFKKEFQIFNL